MISRYKGAFLALACSLSAVIAGCGEDDPISSQEEHFEAEGLVIVDSGVRFFRYFQGQIDAADNRTDHLEAEVAELTGHWSIRFLDGAGSEFAAPTDPDFRFTWVIADPSIVEVVQDPGDEGKFEFHLRGLQAGETTIVLEVTHVDHADFRTIPIAVHVEEHFEAEGLVLVDSGVRFFRYFQGVVDTTGGRHNHLEAPIGLTGHWSIKFLDGEGTEFDAPTGGELTFGYTIADPTLLEVFQDPGDEGSFEFHLRGLAEGETTIILSVLHEGHADFSTLPLSVHIEATAGQHGEPMGVRVKDEESGKLLTETPLAGQGETTGTLTVVQADSTDHLEVQFFDAQGVEFQPAAPPHALGIAVADTTLLGIDPPMDPEFWAFRLIGRAAGATTITLSILHDGDPEETFATIPVTVTAP
ncbi:MAG: hypothetical protein CME19_13935 [Gemmatimonadetes bacterium]|mgnify:CR=1 FL=1|nr:hypothetical protein [Gemmatimonadota bacterium]